MLDYSERSGERWERSGGVEELGGRKKGGRVCGAEVAAVAELQRFQAVLVHLGDELFLVNPRGDGWESENVEKEREEEGG
jgi:hypothetical protein